MVNFAIGEMNRLNWIFFSLPQSGHDQNSEWFDKKIEFFDRQHSRAWTYLYEKPIYTEYSVSADVHKYWEPFCPRQNTSTTSLTN